MTRVDGPSASAAVITAGILAGGQGVRMGGVDKGLCLLAGRPMIEYVLAALRGQASRVLISANRNLDRYQSYGVDVLADRDPEVSGPLAGMAVLLHAAATEWLLVVPCDGPRVPADLGLRLWRAALDAQVDLAVVECEGRLQPTFALLRRTLLPALEDYAGAGGRAVKRWYATQRMVAVDCSDSAAAFVNVNTPEERQRVARELGSPADGAPA